MIALRSIKIKLIANNLTSNTLSVKYLEGILTETQQGKYRYKHIYNYIYIILWHHEEGFENIFIILNYFKVNDPDDDISDNYPPWVTKTPPVQMDDNGISVIDVNNIVGSDDDIKSRDPDLSSNRTSYRGKSSYGL